MRDQVAVSEFQKYLNMIRDRAWYYCKKYGQEFKEVESEGFKIYLEALERYDPDKGSFSTHLWSRLRTLGDFCKKQQRDSGVSLEVLVDYMNLEMEEGQAEDYIEAPEYGITQESFLAEAKEELPWDSYRILFFLVKREWDRHDRKWIPSRTWLKQYFIKHEGYCYNQFMRAWESLENYWLGRKANGFNTGLF